MPEPLRLDLDFLKYEHIADKADAFLAGIGRSGELPVDVEAIIELDLEMDIVPIAGLQHIDIEAFTTSDLTRTYIDEWVYQHRVHRARFSLAHEVGHVVLHRHIFEQLNFTNIREWQDFYAAVDPDQYGWLEWQACNFGGLLLVPRHHLRREFRTAASRIQPRIEEAKRHGINSDTYLEYAIAAIAEDLRPVFDVSPEALSKRLEKDGLGALL